MHCYNCNQPLVGNNISVEHIIPQSIGGRLKSKSLLCVRCNSVFGSSIDAAVEKCYESLIALLSLERERSDQLPVLKNLPTPSGGLYRLVDGKYAEIMHPSVVKTEEGYNITARNQEQFKDILKGFKRKNPSLNIDEVMAGATYIDTYLNEPLQISFLIGGEIMLRGIGKIAVNYYIDKFGNAPFLKNIINVINGSAPLEQTIHLIPATNYSQLDENEVSHTILLRAIPESKLLYAWVNLFCYSSFIVVLSTEYAGPPVEDTFCYDVLMKEERNKEVKIDYNGPQDYCATTLSEDKKLEISNAIQESINIGMRLVIGVARKKQFSGGLAKIAAEAIEEELKAQSATHFTEEVLDAAMRKFSQKAGPFIAQFLRRNQIEKKQSGK